MNNQISIEMPSCIVPYRSTRHSNNNINNLTVSMENNESIIRPFGNSFFPSTISIWNSNIILNGTVILKFISFRAVH